MSKIGDISARPTRITLHDVAAAAGVSKSTASRILDERLPRSESETASRVRQAAAELGYVRDLSAASLRRGHTSTIGVILPRLTDIVMAMLYEAVSSACHKNGLFTVVATCGDEPESHRDAAEALLRRGVSGLILTTARTGEAFIHELESREIPYVLALRTTAGAPSSVADDRFGGYLATRHLLDLGHRRIGIIAGQTFASSAAKRVEGYREAMQEAGAEILEGYIVHSGFDIEAGVQAAAALVAHPQRPTAIFAVNDNIAVGATSLLYSMGLSIPEDVSIVGYHDIPIVRHLATPLTSVRVPFDQIAAAAVELLCVPPATATNRLRIATPTLVPRRSTARHVERS